VVHDFDGVEGAPGSVVGLGFLDVETTLKADKTVREVRGLDLRTGVPVHGYEIHLGETDGPDRANEWLDLEDGGLKRPEGAVSADGSVMGSYVHGLFSADGFRRAFLGRLRAGRGQGVAYDDNVERALDAVASHLERHLDLDRLLAVAGG
jgi:adenosylcobyric acid synthase